MNSAIRATSPTENEACRRRYGRQPFPCKLGERGHAADRTEPRTEPVESIGQTGEGQPCASRRSALWAGGNACLARNGIDRQALASGSNIDVREAIFPLSGVDEPAGERARV